MPPVIATQSHQYRRRWAAFAALSVPPFRLYWSGLILYVVGWNVEYVTFAWLAWELTHDPLSLGSLGLAQGAPVLLFQLFGGVLADRAARLRLLIGSQFVTGLVLATAFALTVSGTVRVEYLLLLAALSGTFRAFEQPSRMALIPHLVERKHLANAIALGSIPWQGGRVIGPSIAGVLIAAFGTTVGFAVAALGYFLAIGLYSRIRIPHETASPPRQGMLRNMLEGFTFVGRNPLFASLIGLTFFNSLFGMSYVALLPIFADRYLGAGSSGYGLMQTATGIGAVVGTLTIAAIAHRLRHRGRILLLGGAGFGLLLVLFSQSPTLLFALIVVALMGFSNTFYLTLVNTTLQEHVPDALRGRVMGIYGLCWNLIPIGGILGGLLAATVDARFAVTVGGALVAVMAVLLMVFSTRLRTLA